MNKFVSASLFSALLIGGLSMATIKVSPSNAAKSNPKFIPALKGNAIPGSYIVVMADQTLPGRIQVAATRKALQNKAMVSARSLLASTVRGRGRINHVYYAALNGFAVKLSDADALKLSQDPRVKYVAEDGKVTIADADASSHLASSSWRIGRAAGTQLNPPNWGLDRIDQRALPLNNTYNYPTGGYNVHAYVLDTGIEYTHPEFGGRATFDANTVPGDTIRSDCFGHGTHVAGIVGSKTYGVAKLSKLHGVKVLKGCTGNGTISDTAAGVDWVTANSLRPAVSNLSLQFYGSVDAPVLGTAVKNSINSGVTYVIAAGNASTDSGQNVLTLTPEAIIVGATDRSDTKAYFSNYGYGVDIWAPGVDILSTFLNNGTRFISGTSMATPHVAGAVAMYLQGHPNATSAQVQSVVTSVCTKNVGLGLPYGPNCFLGWN